MTRRIDAPAPWTTTLAQVPSSLIARHESWVRQQAHALARRLPSNVEKADLIQVGLIAVAHSAVTFRWPQDHRSNDPDDAFITYAKQRVRGAMLDELRQMDHLTRPQRRKVKALQIVRERWMGLRGSSPTLAELAAHCKISVDEVVRLDAMAASIAYVDPLPEAEETDGAARHPCTPCDEVEARVDTEIVLRRLARIWPELPPRDRRVIDAYLGVGVAPVELAREMKVSMARVSQWHRAAVDRIARRVGTQPARAGEVVARITELDPLETHQDQHQDIPTPHHRAADLRRMDAQALEQRVAQREKELARSPSRVAWSDLVQRALSSARPYTIRNDTVPSGP